MAKVQRTTTGRGFVVVHSINRRRLAGPFKTRRRAKQAALAIRKRNR